MTISELIERLQQYPSDMEVLVDAPRMGGCYVKPTLQKVFIGTMGYQKDCLAIKGIIKSNCSLNEQLKEEL